MQAFYQAWPSPKILQTPSGEFAIPQLSSRFRLSWSAYVRLLSLKRPEARSFYETEALRSGWSIQQSQYSKVDDFVFPPLVKDGRVPIRTSMFVQDHLRPAVLSTGVVLAQGQRFGLHNLRHSLSTWLVNKVSFDEGRVVLLRHLDTAMTGPSRQ